MVVATLGCNAPWGGCPIGLPIEVGLHKKGGLETVHDPDGIYQDDFFVKDNESFSDVDVVAHYSRRWSRQVTFRDVKQFLGGEDLQS